MEGLIMLAATPIGNDEDASPRLRSAIESADIIAAEDTRRFLNLAGRLGLHPRGRIVSSYEHNEAGRVPYLLEQAEAGSTVLVVSDAGMPTISDPGFRIVSSARQAGVRVTVIPGPSAVLSALAVSGLATDRFSFEGFPPRKPSEQKALFASLAYDAHTLIFFESPRRLGATLAVMSQQFGSDRPACVCRELTKTHEEVVPGTLGELAEKYAEGALGEIVIVVQGASSSIGSLGSSSARRDSGSLRDDGDPHRPDVRPNVRESPLFIAGVNQVHDLHRLGLRVKDAAEFVASHETRIDLRKRDLYEAALALEQSLDSAASDEAR
ncbi:MAG: 16S rRNA (cytidine(1402)-2'-O)-methyltransferase [Actinomycetaceae bacterium]|nr:16S rRNA (cytidine(1402)-2'-O)-methyltransferase [Actinomycetaceae bacterium]MDY6083533.1 16S rRNA (cytidine(1402)-2'-O)-methyltransferase [Actinomycetaceae bacterium]